MAIKIFKERTAEHNSGYKRRGKEDMEDKNDSLKPDAGSIQPWMIAVIVIGVAWLIGTGILALVSSVKHM